MYAVTGANLFGQWFSWRKNRDIFEKFEVLSHPSGDSGFDLNRAKLVCSCWSYNIFQVNSNYYIAGTWQGKGNQLINIPVPEACTQSAKQSKLLIAGNDYMLIFVEATKRTIWLYDLESESVKKVLITEEPVAKSTAKKPRTVDEIIKVIVTNDVFIYLSSNGNVYSGQLPSFIDTSDCVGKVCDIQCGYEHYMLLTDEGRVYTWGNGRRLQLGHGDLTNLDKPTEVEALAGVKITKIAAGGWHSLALSESGDLYVWGWNDTGQLGMDLNKDDQQTADGKSLKNFALPVLVDIYDEDEQEVELCIKDIACGSRHSAILLDDDTIWTAGCNKYGQLGFSSKQYEKLDYFKKSFYSPNINNLSCGLWSTYVQIQKQ